MANLETLELTINANAQSASKGISSLISSLSALSEALVKPFNDLKNLNNALTVLRSNAKIKFDVSGSVGQGSSARKTAKKVAAIPEDYDWGNNRAINRASDTFSQARYDADFKKAGEAYYARMAADSARNAEWRSRWQTAVSSGKNIITNADVRIPTDEEIEKLNNATREGAKDQKSFWQSIKETGNKLKDVIPKFKFLSKSIKMATTMLLRMAIRAFFKGAIEGYKNYYQYAKATGNSLATEMDKINNSWQQIKNQMGASLASVFSAFIPVLNSLANAAITAFNYVSQLLALLTGKGSWSKASEVSGSLDDVGKSAGGAGGKVKELLADFDELNVIASESGGGGGGSAAADATEMFEEVYEFDSRIRALVDFIKNNMESIKGIAIAIGTAILAWKFADAFAETLPILSKLFGLISAGAVIAITLQVTWMLTNQYLDTGNIGWLIADVFTTAVGATAAAAIAQHFIGGNAGAWVAAITLTFSAITGIVALVGNSDVSAISKEGLAVSVENALKVGAAAAVLSHMTGASVGMALKGGAVVALATFGATVAIKATADVIQTGEITKSTIAADVIAALTIGAAAGFLALIGGASAGLALAGGAIAAIATFAVVIAIQATSTANHISVDSNLIHLTEEQVTAFVSRQMFTVNPAIMINVTGNNVKQLKMDEESIISKLSEMMGILHVVKLGLATDNDYIELKKGILDKGGLIDRVNAWINEAQNTGKLVLKFTPVFAGETEEEQTEWYQAYSGSWDTVKGFLNKLGAELADQMVEGENGELIMKRPERVQALLEEIATISAIIAGTDTKVEAEIEFELALKDLDQSSFNAAMKKYHEMKDSMAAAAEEFVTTAYANQARVVAALKAMLSMASTPEEKAQIQAQLDEAEAALEEFKKNWDEKLQKQIDEWTAPEKSMMQEWLEKNFNPGTFTINWTDEMFESMFNTEGLEEVLRQIFENNNMDTTNLDIMDILEVGGWDLLTEDIKKKILKSITPDDDTIALLKKGCKLSATEILTMSNWNSFSTTQKLQMINALTKAFGSNEALNAAKKAGIDIDKLIGEGLASGGTAKDEAEKLRKAIQDALNKKPTVADPIVPKTWGKSLKDTATKLWSNVKTILGKGVTMANPKTSPKYGKSVEAEASGLFKDVKLRLNKNITIANPSVPAKFGNTVKDKATKFLTNIKNTLGKGITIANPTVPKEFGVQVKSTAKTIYKDVKILLGQKLETKDVKAPKEFGKGIKTTASDIYKNVKERISKGLITSDVSVPDGFGNSAIQEADDVQHFMVEDIDDPLQTADVTTPSAFGNGVLSAARKLMQNVKNILDEKLQIKVGLSYDGSKVIIHQKQTPGGTEIGGETITPYALGGMVKYGQLFIAGEAGPELVGTIGNQSAVANQGQIIEGIRKGVSDAQSEQNALLRQQNALLQSILEKDNSVRLTASSALGRTVRQSLNMYSAVTGG